MTRFDYRRAFFVSAGLLALLLTAGGAYLLGSIRVYSTNQAAGNSLVDQLPQVLHADSASGGKTVSTATGMVLRPLVIEVDVSVGHDPKQPGL